MAFNFNLVSDKLWAVTYWFPEGVSSLKVVVWLKICRMSRRVALTFRTSSGSSSITLQVLLVTTSIASEERPGSGPRAMLCSSSVQPRCATSRRCPNIRSGEWTKAIRCSCVNFEVGLNRGHPYITYVGSHILIPLPLLHTVHFRTPPLCMCTNWLLYSHSLFEKVIHVCLKSASMWKMEHIFY